MDTCSGASEMLGKCLVSDVDVGENRRRRIKKSRMEDGAWDACVEID